MSKVPTATEIILSFEDKSTQFRKKFDEIDRLSDELLTILFIPFIKESLRLADGLVGERKVKK